MKNFEEIKDLWHNTAPQKDLPALSEIISKIESTRKKIMRKNLISTIILCLTFIFIVWIGFKYDFEFITTKIGLMLVLISIAFGIFCNFKLINRLSGKIDITSDTKSYLQQMLTFRNKQRVIQTKGMMIYFIILTSGLILYEIEFAVRDLTFGIVYYACTLGWMAFVWFYLRKKTIAKQDKQINEQITMIENLSADLKS
jgi:hypothetical protein